MKRPDFYVNERKLNKQYEIIQWVGSGASAVAVYAASKLVVHINLPTILAYAVAGTFTLLIAALFTLLVWVLVFRKKHGEYLEGQAIERQRENQWYHDRAVERHKHQQPTV